MPNPEYNTGPIGPEYPKIEYSGAHSQDSRDPQTLGELMPETMAEIAQAAHTTELGAAHQRLLELEQQHATDPASVTDSELQAAKTAVSELRRKDAARFLRRLPD